MDDYPIDSRRFLRFGSLGPGTCVMLITVVAQWGIERRKSASEASRLTYLSRRRTQSLALQLALTVTINIWLRERSK
jgi:hypothetical protein